MTPTPQHEDGGGCTVVGGVDPPPAPQMTGRAVGTASPHDVRYPHTHVQASKAMTTTPRNEDGGGCPVVGEVDPQPAPQATGRPRPFTRLHLPRQHKSSIGCFTTATSRGARRSLGVDDVVHQGLPRLATSRTRSRVQASKTMTLTQEHEDGGGCPVVSEVDPPPAQQTTGRPRPLMTPHLPRQHKSSIANHGTATSHGARRSLGVRSRNCRKGKGIFGVELNPPSRSSHYPTTLTPLQTPLS